jgi:hypothetical protein
MSKIVALYVYSPTEFTTDTTIETIDGRTLAPDRDHRVTLAAGLYRFREGAKVTPVQQLEGDGFDTNIHTKGDPGDPPLRALERLNLTRTQIDAFLNGAGRAQAI